MGLSQTLSSWRAVTASILLVAILVCLCGPSPASAGPAVYYGKGGKVRTIRGFKNVVLSTARNFGKRDPGAASDGEVAVDMSGDPASPPAGADLARPRGVPVPVPVSMEWFVEAIAANPDFARAIIRKYLDDNKDGELSPEELLRTTY